MLNFKKNIYFLALQKYLSLEELIVYLNLNTTEILELATKYGRTYPDIKRYLEEIFLNTFVLPAEIIGFIYGNIENITLDGVVKHFKIDKIYLTKTLYHYATRYPDILDRIVINNILHQEILDAFTQICIDSQQNLLDIEKISKLSPTKSIEEIGLIFNCAPILVEQELVRSGIGGFWYNENIRINYPYFFSDSKNKFSVSELIYILNRYGMYKNKQQTYVQLAKKMHTTTRSIEYVISLIAKIDMPAEAIIKILQKENIVCKNWVYVQELLMLDKENSEYLYRYEVSELFYKQDIELLQNTFQKVLDRVQSAKEMLDVSASKYIVVSTQESVVGNLLYKNNFYSVYIADGKKRVLNNADILLYKKVY